MINQGDALQLGTPQKKRFQKEFPRDVFPEYYIIKVNKFNDIAKSPLDEWIYYFKNSELPSKCDQKILSLLSEKLKFDAMTVKEKKAYLKHKKNLLVSKSALETAYLEGLDKGEEKGMKRGIEKRDIEVVINCFKNGFNISQISVITSMSEEEVEDILRKQGLL